MVAVVGARRRWLGAAACAAALATGAAPASAFHDAAGLHVRSQRALDARLSELSLATDALPSPPGVRILVPDGYAEHPDRRYPVLYLLDGTSGYASDWTQLGGAEPTTAGRPLIVVMPDITLNGDGGGWCTDWPDGAERWETFHVAQLVPWVDANLRTVPDRAGRAIAGLSQGGFCSMSYAARHPDLFSVALAFSGPPDIDHDPVAHQGAEEIINATEVGLTHVPPNTFFGDPVTDEINWAAHDPATLAENLRHTLTYLYWGNGQPGPLDANPVNPYGSFIEGAIAYDNGAFRPWAQSLGLPASFTDYGNGTHIWPYWARDLAWSIGAVDHDLAHPLPAPSVVDYTSGDDAYSVYGWTVTTHRTARELSTLGSAGPAGFSLTGSGSATVTTPGAYAPDGSYGVTLSGPHASGSFPVRADARGRLSIAVALGPSNPYQQYTAQARAAGEAFFTTHVAIAGAGGAGAGVRGTGDRGAGRCASGRWVVVHLAGRGRASGVRARIDGRAVRFARVGATGVRVDLRRFARGRFVVVVSGRVGGRARRAVRVLHTCRAGRRRRAR